MPAARGRARSAAALALLACCASAQNDVGFLKSPPPPSPPPAPPPFPPPMPPLYRKSTSEAYVLLLYATILAYHARPLQPEDRPAFIPDQFWPPSQRTGNNGVMARLMKLVSFPWVFVIILVFMAITDSGWSSGAAFSSAAASSNRLLAGVEAAPASGAPWSCSSSEHVYAAVSMWRRAHHVRPAVGAVIGQAQAPETGPYAGTSTSAGNDRTSTMLP